MRRPSKLKLRAPAHALLLALARGEAPDICNFKHLEAGFADGAIWRDALGLAERHGIAPLLHEQAQAGLLPRLPESARRELRSARIAELAREEKRARGLARALAALAGESNGRSGRAIPVLLLKGAASARTLYRAPELRPRSDLDLLIAPADRELALARLAARGYAQHAKTRGTREDEEDWHERTLVDPIDPAQELDLHFALAQPARHRLDARRLLDASLAEPALGAAARILPPEPAALVCAHSLAIHELAAPLVSLCDFARLLARADVEKLSQLAREVRLVRALHLAAELLALLGPPASRSSSLFARAAPCAAYSLCGAPVVPAQLEALLANSPLSLAARRLLRSAAAGYQLSRTQRSRPRRLWLKALFIDRAQDAARFAAVHALQTIRRAARRAGSAR